MYLIDIIIDENIKHLRGTYEAKRTTDKQSAVLRKGRAAGTAGQVPVPLAGSEEGDCRNDCT
tara:strand:+ start:655 stop:840 length:186 start_codon:yes stop_codon:yes gene_type:complete